MNRARSLPHFTNRISLKASVPDRTEGLARNRPVWVLDAQTKNCMNGFCNARFTAIKRRHHCRHCGKVYCKKCCNSKVKISYMNYDDPVLVCNDCKLLVEGKKK